VHGDFGSHNFAFDEATGMPVGLFDFHDAGRAPRAVDLKLCPSYGEEALSIALEHYGVSVPLADVRLAHAVSALAYLAWRAEDPDAHDRGSGRDRAAAIAWANEAVQGTATAKATDQS
jgi:Ser/Thr protein kinase RdoA (MazF antagonist)